MAKPFSKEDIPSFLDRETGKFKPLFDAPEAQDEMEAVKQEVSQELKDLNALQYAVSKLAEQILGVKTSGDIEANTYVMWVETSITKYAELQTALEDAKKEHVCNCNCEKAPKNEKVQEPQKKVVAKANTKKPKATKKAKK